jgi:hypothetical protein
MKNVLARIFSILVMLVIVGVGIWLFQPILIQQALDFIAPSSFRQLTENLSTDYNPVINDKGQIIYSCSGLADDEICSINLDGSDFRQLTHNPVSDFWNPIINEQGQIAFECSRGGEGGRKELCIYSEAIQGLRVIAHNYIDFEGHFALSDSNELLYDCQLESEGICIATWDADGLPLSREFLIAGRHPVINSVGQLVYYCTNPNRTTIDLCITSITTLDVKYLNLPSELNREDSFDINNLGQIVFVCRDLVKNNSEICSINSDGSGFLQLTTGHLEDSIPKINDRGQIVFQCQEISQQIEFHRDEPEICGVHVDGSGYRVISQNLLAGISPSINNDGTIAYSCFDTEPEICVTKFDEQTFSNVSRYQAPHQDPIQAVAALNGNGCVDLAGTFVMAWGTRGLGDYQFRFAAKTFEESQSIGGIAIDGDSAIFVSDLGNHRIQKFSPEGVFLGSIGESGSEQGQLRFPVGLAVGQDGSLFAGDRGNVRVQVFSNVGDFIEIIDNRESVFAPDWWLRGLAFDQLGNFYAVNQHQILKFRDTGVLQGAWGTYGTGPTRTLRPSGLATSEDNHIYVTDVGSHRIQKFMLDGTSVDTWGGFGFGPGQFNAPTAIAINHLGDIYIADARNHRVQKFRPDGEYVAEWGTRGGAAGQFNLPTGIAVDENNYVYVVDAGNNRIQKFCGGN